MTYKEEFMVRLPETEDETIRYDVCFSSIDGGPGIPDYWFRVREYRLRDGKWEYYAYTDYHTFHDLSEKDGEYRDVMERYRVRHESDFWGKKHVGFRSWMDYRFSDLGYTKPQYKMPEE